MAEAVAMEAYHDTTASQRRLAPDKPVHMRFTPEWLTWLLFWLVLLYFTTTLIRSNIWHAKSTQEKTMIRIRPKRRFHISNRLALVSALALSLTLFSGVDGLQNGTPEGASQAKAVETQPTEVNDGSDPAERRKQFSISRLLFGHG
jgi:hypothetical protein